ncbi:MAG: DUF560 domain-containing protein [Sphingomonas sp.]|nr:DUF560 domain-containing protein [Sphingomonas sp.]
MRWLVLLVMLWSASASSAPTTLRASAAQMLAAAERLDKAGRPDQARRFYRALLSDRSGEVRLESRFRLAMLDKKQGRIADAASALQALLLERPDAARVRLELASLYLELGNEGGARRELRRVRSGPLPAEVARVVDRWSAALSARRPLGASFNIALAPDTNINRSTRSDTLGTIIGDFEIDENSKAKSGLGLALRAQAWGRLRLDRAGQVALLARLSSSADLYRRESFNDLSLSTMAGPEVTVGRTRSAIEIGAGQSWYGGKASARYVQLSGRTRVAVDDRSAVSASLSLASVDNRLNDLQDGRNTALEGSVERALTPRNGVLFTASGQRLAARDPGYSTRSWRVGITGWQEVGQSVLFAGVEYGRLKADERLLLFPEKRQDRSLKLTVGGTLRSINVAGFSPVVRVTRERNKSNIAFTDYERTRTEFGLTRAF